jgi:hypothetical protein
MNVYELDRAGNIVAHWCFAPKGDLAMGDVLLAQKIALETMEREALNSRGGHLIALVAGLRGISATNFQQADSRFAEKFSRPALGAKVAPGGTREAYSVGTIGTSPSSGEGSFISGSWPGQTRCCQGPQDRNPRRRGCRCSTGFLKGRHRPV